MKPHERIRGLYRAPQLLVRIMIGGRYDFVYDQMPIRIRHMSWSQRVNLARSGLNLVHRRLQPWSLPLHMQFELVNYCHTALSRMSHGYRGSCAPAASHGPRALPEGDARGRAPPAYDVSLGLGGVAAPPCAGGVPERGTAIQCRHSAFNQRPASGSRRSDHRHPRTSPDLSHCSHRRTDG